ncbi:hypothetical protein M0R45_027408 [Rubus argutus]|uniref:Uncharacterized protein n=1 Tax=Rubus argutus TaxID=59490 RepID=A0AAW1X0Z5_RUBAR
MQERTSHQERQKLQDKQCDDYETVKFAVMGQLDYNMDRVVRGIHNGKLVALGSGLEKMGVSMMVATQKVVVPMMLAVKVVHLMVTVEMVKGGGIEVGGCVVGSGDEGKGVGGGFNGGDNEGG